MPGPLIREGMEEAGGYSASKKQVRREGSYFPHSSLCFKILFYLNWKEKKNTNSCSFSQWQGVGSGESDRKHL